MTLIPQCLWEVGSRTPIQKPTSMDAQVLYIRQHRLEPIHLPVDFKSTLDSSQYPVQYKYYISNCSTLLLGKPKQKKKITFYVLLFRTY